MYDILFYVPHQIGGWPLFGWGIVATLWLVAGGAGLAWTASRQGWSADLTGSLLLWAVGAAAFIWLAPRMEDEDPVRHVRLGIAIHGYGVLVTLGVVTGVGLAMREGRRMGADSEVIYGLAMRLFIAGIIGARVFYVVLNWQDYERPTWRETFVEVVKFTQGGLVVYGAFLAALVAGWFYLRERKLPVLAMADLAAPVLLLGLAFGRIGCFLHGCCFGGECDPGKLAVTFPNSSPPYYHQLQRGRMHGIALNASGEGQELEVVAIDPQGPAAGTGLNVGDKVRAVNGVAVNSSSRVWFPPGANPLAVEITTLDGRTARWTAPPLPLRSHTVHPIQLYSSASAAALALLLWSWYPLRRRDGELIAGLLVLYPVSRILEEAVRDDEPGRWGTPLTISQWVSVGLLLAGCALWWYVLRRPEGCSRFDAPPA